MTSIFYHTITFALCIHYRSLASGVSWCLFLLKESATAEEEEEKERNKTKYFVI
jgi:hypothetical protein